MRFAVRSRGEEQSVFRTSSFPVPEGKSPETINPQRLAFGVAKRPETLRFGSSALMRPLPKFPTSSALLNSPKFDGASAKPQGEFNAP